MFNWCKINCPPQYNGTYSVPPREQVYSLSVFPQDCRKKKKHIFMTQQWLTGGTLFKRIILCRLRLSAMHWRRIYNSSSGRYGLCLQWGKCWFVFHWSEGHCQPQYSKTCSVPPREQMYLLSVLSIWLEEEQPSCYDTTKTGRFDWFLKEVSYADTTWCNVLKDYFQLFSRDLYNVQTGNEVYRNHCGMNTSNLHMPWLNV